MPRHEESIEIRRPLPEVYAYMDDIDREREWQTHLVEAEQTPIGPTRVGTRRRYVSEFMGKRLENTYVVLELDEGRHLVCETTPDSAVSARSEIHWVETQGVTRVTMSIDGKAGGLLRFVPPKLIEAAFRSELESALARLKERLEGE